MKPKRHEHGFFEGIITEGVVFKVGQIQGKHVAWFSHGGIPLHTFRPPRQQDILTVHPRSRHNPRSTKKACEVELFEIPTRAVEEFVRGFKTGLTPAITRKSSENPPYLRLPVPVLKAVEGSCRGQKNRIATPGRAREAAEWLVTGPSAATEI